MGFRAWGRGQYSLRSQKVALERVQRLGSPVPLICRVPVSGPATRAGTHRLGVGMRAAGRAGYRSSFVARAHGARGKKRSITRGKLLGFLVAQAPCVVAMEACASAHLVIAALLFGTPFHSIAADHPVQEVRAIDGKVLCFAHRNLIVAQSSGPCDGQFRTWLPGMG